MAAQRLRPAQYLFEVAAVQGQCGHPGHRPYGVLPLRVRREQHGGAEGVTVGQYPQYRLVAVLAGAEAVELAVGDQDDPVRRPARTGQHITRRELPLDEPVRQRLQRPGVGVAAQRRQLPQLGGNHPDFGAGRDEIHPAVTEGVGQPAVDAVRTAGDLRPGQDAQQPAGRDPLHLRHGLGRGRQLAGGRGVQAGPALLDRGLLRSGRRIHRCGHEEGSPVLVSAVLCGAAVPARAYGRRGRAGGGTRPFAGHAGPFHGPFSGRSVRRRGRPAHRAREWPPNSRHSRDI